jgi:hypothetical protein
MFPSEKIDIFCQCLTQLISDNWPWANPTVSEVASESFPGFFPLTDGGISIIIPTNFYDCPLAIASSTKLIHIANAEMDGYEVDDYLRDCPLFIKFYCLYLDPNGNGGTYRNPVTLPTIITQSYVCFDEYGRDYNGDIVGFGKSGNMTTKGMETTYTVAEFAPLDTAQALFNHIANHSPVALIPT